MSTKKDSKISTVEIFLYLRQRLLNARDQNDLDTLRTLATVFDMLWDLAVDKKNQGRILGVLENLENSAYDTIQGVGWKSIIPTEEEIKSVLGNEEMN
jgi:hypothetical protein